MYIRKKRNYLTNFYIFTLLLILFICTACIIKLNDKKTVNQNTVYYYQNDPRWADNPLGASGFTMKSSGCLTTSIAISLGMQIENTEHSPALDPGQVNRLFTRYGVYNENGEIIWDKIAEALGNIGIYTAEGVEAAEINTLLSEGRYPLAKVTVPESGSLHWVVITGIGPAGYECADPANSSEKEVTLSKYGNTIQTIRCVYWE